MTADQDFAIMAGYRLKTEVVEFFFESLSFKGQPLSGTVFRWQTLGITDLQVWTPSCPSSHESRCVKPCSIHSSFPATGVPVGEYPFQPQNTARNTSPLQNVNSTTNDIANCQNISPRDSVGGAQQNVLTSNNSVGSDPVQKDETEAQSQSSPPSLSPHYFFGPDSGELKHSPRSEPNSRSSSADSQLDSLLCREAPLSPTDLSIFKRL